ncbi:MAG: hypothetical protein AAGC71_07015 [Pseudomonadota bacterium]
MKLSKSLAIAALGLALAACERATEEDATTDMAAAVDTVSDDISVSDAERRDNPLLKSWDTPYGVPPFKVIEDEHYLPAVKQGILERRDEIAAIVKQDAAPTFENTIVAIEKSGGTLSRVLRVFGNITGTDTNDTLKALQAQIYPMVTRESNAIVLNPDLFARVKAVYDERDSLGLNEVDARLLELTHREFVRAGAALTPDAREQVADINAELSSLSTRFGQNLLAATKDFKLRVTDEADLAGLSDGFRASLWNADEEAWLVGLNRSQFETFMTESTNRDLRKQLFDAYRTRAADADLDNYA